MTPNDADDDDNYNFSFCTLQDADFTGKPSVLLVGQYSTGKTTLIRFSDDYDDDDDDDNMVLMMMMMMMMMMTFRSQSAQVFAGRGLHGMSNWSGADH